MDSNELMYLNLCKFSRLFVQSSFLLLLRSIYWICICSAFQQSEQQQQHKFLQDDDNVFALFLLATSPYEHRVRKHEDDGEDDDDCDNNVPALFPGWAAGQSRFIIMIMYYVLWLTQPTLCLLTFETSDNISKRWSKEISDNQQWSSVTLTMCSKFLLLWEFNF